MEERIEKLESGSGHGRTRPQSGVEERIDELLDRAWTERMAHHSPTLVAAVPNRTLPVTVTGAGCGLACLHCRGHYLRTMLPKERAIATYHERGFTSCLISGGCDVQGQVPLGSHLGFLQEMKRNGARLNLHVGLAGPDTARQLAGLADSISLDFVGDDETVREVYGLDRPAGDYVETYREFAKFLPVYPHVCIGLRGGKISGEYRALEQLAGLQAPVAVFLVLIPTRGTPYEHVSPPSLEEVSRVLATARVMMPRASLYLGCMRPGGTYRKELDQLAVRSGVQKIVQPARAALELATRLGLAVHRQEECCVL
ncbi:MAG: radical SAM protein [Bacillota bacterium]